MFISRNREKIINAMIFFVGNTRHCLTTKLFKLLNFLDFEHYRLTGRSVTGLEYKAWQKGPAPADLWHEIQDMPKDLSAAIPFEEIKDELTGEPRGRTFKPKKKFDKSYFSARELEIMNLLAEIFKDTKADDMVGISHARGYPWEKIYRNGAGKGRLIPYDLALSSDGIIGSLKSLSKDEIEFRAKLHKKIEAEAV